MTARYVRPLSGLERYSLVLNDLYRYHVEGIVEGIGEVDPHKLQAAVDRAAEANPAIRVRLRGFLGFSRWVDSGIAPKVTLLPLSDWDGNSEQHTEALRKRMEVTRGAAVADVYIVPCRDGYTRIMFRAAHAAIDGRGFMHWVAEVCRAMRGEPLLGSDSRLTDLDIQEKYKDEIEPEAPRAPSNCIPVIPPDADRPAALSYIWRRLIIPQNLHQLLPRLAIFLAQYARAREPGEVGFTIPIDYRGLRTEEMGIGNLTGYVRLTVEPETSMRGLLQQLIKHVKAKADCRQFPGIRKLLWVPVWLLLRKLTPHVDAILHTVSPALPTGGLVSMGNVHAEAYSFPGFDARMLYGIPGAVGKLNIIFLNYPDFTVISFAAPTSYNQGGQLDRLIDAIAQHFTPPATPQ